MVYLNISKKIKSILQEIKIYLPCFNLILRYANCKIAIPRKFIKVVLKRCNNISVKLAFIIDYMINFFTIILYKIKILGHIAL